MLTDGGRVGVGGNATFGFRVSAGASPLVMTVTTRRCHGVSGVLAVAGLPTSTIGEGEMSDRREEKKDGESTRLAESCV